VSACASVESGSTQASGGDDDDAGVGPPQRGGTLVYGLEAETTNGWCLPEGQLAIAGIQVARSIYDTLTVPTGDGSFAPFLAESVTPNADYTQWTITLRPGVTFHDGSPLTAEVVKNNLDAYRAADRCAAEEPTIREVAPDQYAACHFPLVESVRSVAPPAYSRQPA
jgi:peptide/nickel transport system substrate-binding protein